MSERPSAEILDILFAVIDSKRNDNPETSYTAQLLAAAPEKPALKLAEGVQLASESGAQPHCIDQWQQQVLRLLLG